MRLATVLALTALTALPAQAALQYTECEFEQMVASAVNVIQITDQDVALDEFYCTVIGTVVRSFRGSIAPGTLVQTSFYCGEFASMTDVGHDPEAVARAKVVEIHGQAGGGPAGYGRGLLLLDGLTDAPTYPFRHLGEC